MKTNTNNYKVAVHSETTGREVISFNTDKKENVRKDAYQRIAEFLGINRAIASLNYYVEVSAK